MITELKDKGWGRSCIDWAARHNTALAGALLMLGAFSLYANTFGHQWVYDDLVVLVRNPDIQSWSEFLQNSYPGRPLRELTYLLEYQLFELNPAGYHLQNIFWHGLNALLVFLLVGRLGGNRPAAWCAAVLFLVHPLPVEVVANISHRKDSLALAFSLLAVLAYTKACDTEGRWRLSWVVAAMGLAVTAYMGKQIAVALLPVFVAYEAAFLDRRKRILLRRPRIFWPVVAFALAGLGWWAHASGLFERYYWEIQGVTSKLGHVGTVTVDMYFATLMKAFFFMAGKIVAPVGLGVEYSLGVPESWADPGVMAGVGLFVLLLAALAVAYRRAPRIFFGLLWTGAFWLPASGAWPLAYIAADRYLYAPLAGLAIAAGIILGQGVERWPRFVGPVFCGAVLILSVLTWQQSRVWRSPLSLWSHAVEVSPESSYALSSLGKTYINRGQPAMALPLLRKAAEINPYNQDVKRAMAYAERMLRSAGRQ